MRRVLCREQEAAKPADDKAKRREEIREVLRRGAKGYIKKNLRPPTPEGRAKTETDRRESQKTERPIYPYRQQERKRRFGHFQ
ncbi:hypothetical protein HY285_03325 [Candidatus Peregrinibacteria bacterium]|nr:hypothetical protein [Candidatus Peregrinibacteria bacterium]